MPEVVRDMEDSEDEQEDHRCITWSGISKTIPVLLFFPEAIISKDGNICSVGERYKMAFKIVHTDSQLVRGILTGHGFHEVHPNNNYFNLMWTGSHLKSYILQSLQDFQKVNHFPRSYELTRKDCLYKNIQQMQQTHGFKNFHIVPQTFVLPSEYQQFCKSFAKDNGPWIIKPVASSRGRGIYLVSNPNQISMDENILVSQYINNPLLIDGFKFDVRLYVLVTSYDPLLIYVYEEGLARFATVKYDPTSKNIKNTFMHLTNYSVNKKSSNYVSCDDPEDEDYGSKWSMSAMLRYLKQDGKDTTLLMRQVEDLIIKAVLSAELQIAAACKKFVPHKTNCFELYGFDVLIDSNLKPWLLEVNLSPSLACDTPLDLKIKASMIADMFSLVGFVCQDPLLRQPRSDRVTLDPSFKQAAAQRTQKPSSARTATARSRVQKRHASASDSEIEGSKDKQGAKQGQGESTLCLTAEEIKVLRRITEEYERRGGFIRIFPTAESWERYGGYLKSKTSMNYMLADRLFHGRNVSVQLQVDDVHGCHVVQYERKLLSLEARKRRQQHLTDRSAAGKKKLGKKSKTSPTESSSQEGEECAQEERQEVKQVLEPVSHKALVAEQRKEVATPLERCHSKALSSSDAATHNTRPRVNLLNILQQGWDLSKVQARMAFSSYIKRVQQRLLAESRASTLPDWPDKDYDQMELVIRFLKRAAGNLQEELRVVLPSRQLAIQDRRRILSHQLGDFIHSYNQETEQMVKTQEISKEENCVNPSVFQEYITAASENDLEEVLTFYTQKNKSATVILGTKVRSVKKGVHEINASREKDHCESSKPLPVAIENSSALESSLSTEKVSCDPDIKTTESQPFVRVLSEDQQAVVRTGKTQPHIQGPQHFSSFPVTLDCTHIHLQHCSSTPTSLPLHCPPPPPPPQPPSYVQSLAKSQFCYSDPHAYNSGPAVKQIPRATWTVSTGFNTVSTGQPTQMLRRVQSYTSNLSTPGAPSSICSATHIYSQKLSRPTSAGQVNQMSTSSKLKSKSLGTFKELNSLSAQAQSNQQALILASAKQPTQVLRRVQSFTSNVSAPGPPYSICSAMHIYSQKLSRPTSAGQVNKTGNSCKLKSNSAGAFKELNSLSAQPQSNKHTFISVLQKMADEQVESHHARSSHVNLQKQHLTSLNLANKMMTRESFILNPKVWQAAATTPGPVEAVQSGTDLLSSTDHRQLKNEKDLWDRPIQNAYSLVTGVNPQDCYQPTQGSYQLNFAIQQLEQQKLQAQQLLDQSYCQHKGPFPEQTSASHTEVHTNSSDCAPSSFHVPPNQRHGPSYIQTSASPVLAPKPPSRAPEGKIGKVLTRRLMKQTSSESSASGTISSGQHMINCGKTGLSVYRKLFQGQEPSHR